MGTVHEGDRGLNSQATQEKSGSPRTSPHPERVCFSSLKLQGSFLTKSSLSLGPHPGIPHPRGWPSPQEDRDNREAVASRQQ
jgi:hypothetical protein